MMDNETPRWKVQVDLDMLEVAFESVAFGGNRHYLDVHSGEVILLLDEVLSEAERLLDELQDSSARSPGDLAEALQRSPLPQWEHELVEVAIRILEDKAGRYHGVPTADSREGYQDMEKFIATVQSPALEERLWRAIQGRGAFRRFKDVLLDYPAERERWFKFQGDRVRRRVLDWLESVGIEAVD